ncbi:hypothetical protein [Bradyrhizobium sp. CER78]|uniref:hypothetical protein n=1 Tax=Bradyrhizobium sp. CER78 TaxID=3039162 RepID=UPI002448959E|nr:hypothetical protein [Bradyrhizobium sp. CER78]MDH2386221.1 hypothetical protein [Bradyrhizobium sp. CER78]
MKMSIVTRSSGRAALALVLAASGVTPALSAQAVPECSMSVTLADWGENSTGDIDIASGESCQIPIGIRGTVTDSSISQKPAYGKLKKINPSTFEYRAKAKYKGSDSFAIKATGKGPKASGTSVITVHATIK